MRWDLLDKFERLHKGHRAVAVKTFTGREDFLSEHYPGRPVLPEPLLIEMVAQAGGVLFGLSLDFKKEVILAKIDEATFAKELVPPCAFKVEAVIADLREDACRIEGTVWLEDERVASVGLMLVSMDSLTGAPGSQVVFSEKFLKHYDVYAVAKQSEAAHA